MWQCLFFFLVFSLRIVEVGLRHAGRLCGGWIVGRPRLLVLLLVSLFPGSHRSLSTARFVLVVECLLCCVAVGLSFPHSRLCFGTATFLQWCWWSSTSSNRQLVIVVIVVILSTSSTSLVLSTLSSSRDLSDGGLCPCHYQESGILCL